MSQPDLDGIEMIELDADIDGNPFMEGQKPSAVRVFWEHGKRHVENKLAHKKLTDVLKEDKEALKDLYRKYPQFFTPSEADPNKLFYTIAGLTIEIDREETFEVKTFKDIPPPISVASKNAEEMKPLKRGKAKAVASDVEEEY